MQQFAKDVDSDYNWAETNDFNGNNEISPPTADGIDLDASLKLAFEHWREVGEKIYLKKVKEYLKLILS